VGTHLASDDDGEPLSDPCDRHTQLRDQADLAYARDLGTPGFGDTIDVVQTKAKYYRFHPDLNPTRIVPAGPVVSGWLEPHDRQRFGGYPCGDGAPPGPPPPEEIVAADHTPSGGRAGVTTAMRHRSPASPTTVGLGLGALVVPGALGVSTISVLLPSMSADLELSAPQACDTSSPEPEPVATFAAKSRARTRQRVPARWNLEVTE